MKFLSSIRRSKKSNADDFSVDDSSVYTSGMQSRVNAGASVSTHHTTLSQQFSKQRRGVSASKKKATAAAAAKKNKNSSTNSMSYQSSEVSGLASVESYFNNFALPNQEKRFEGGPLLLDRHHVPSKSNALLPDHSDPPPALMQINSLSSSSRSGLFSLNSLKSSNSLKSVETPTAAAAAAALDGSFRSVDARSRESGHPTPRMGCSRKTRLQAVDNKSLAIPSEESFRKVADNKSASPAPSPRKRLLLRSCVSTPSSDQQELRVTLSARDGGDNDDMDGPLPNLCASTATKLVFSDDGMLLCPPSAPSDKSTVLFDNRRIDITNDDDASNYDYNFPNADDESTIDVTIGSKINMTDEELMDERNASPGALRLTEEGLKSHTEMRQEQTISAPKKTPFFRTSSKVGGYDAWKEKQEERKYYRQKCKRRDEELEEKMLAAKERAEQASLSQASQQSKSKQRHASLNSAKRKPQSLINPLVSCTKKEEGVDGVSVSPMDKLNVDVVQQYASSSPASRPSPFGSFRRKKLTSHDLLQAERTKQKQSTVKKEQAEKADFERIKKRREEYLKQHRELEAKAKELRKLNPVAEEVIPVDAPATPINEEASTTSFITNNSSKEDSRDNASASIEEDTFTINTETSTQPCAVCLVGERTHIAMPCMHYSFCEDCVESMEYRGVCSCPVCKARHVSFTKVFF